MKERLLSSLFLGAVTAGIVTWFSASHRHAALAASAARNHQTTGFVLLSGFAGLALFVAVVVFVFTTVFARRPRRGGGSVQSAVPRRTPVGRR